MGNMVPSHRIAFSKAHVLTAVLLAGAIVSSTPAPSNAQEYPTRPVKIIIPYAPGGVPDSAGRLIAEKLAEYFGHPFFVENRTGAGGIIGVSAVVNSESDGHTLLLGASGTLTIGPTLSKNSTFKPSDLAPISLIGAFDFVMLSAPSLRGKSVGDIVDLAKKNPGKLNFASSGFGSEHHLLIELFKLTTGASLTHVPYRGFSSAVTDVVGNRVELLFASIPVAEPFVSGQKVGGLAVTGSKRNKELADLPTFSELGYPDMRMASWVGLLAPATTPQPALQKLAAAMESILQSEEVSVRLGLSRMAPGPEAFARQMQTDTEYWRDIIARTNIQPIE